MDPHAGLLEPTLLPPCHAEIPESASTVVVSSEPLRISVRSQGEESIVLNGEGLLNFEHRREKKEGDPEVRVPSFLGPVSRTHARSVGRLTSACVLQ